VSTSAVRAGFRRFLLAPLWLVPADVAETCRRVVAATCSVIAGISPSTLK
jgi:hypothetical protein